MSSVAMPYTGGDIKKSGELGKMFDLHTEKSRKSGPLTSASFRGTSSHSRPVMPNASGRTSYSGSLSSSISASGSSVSRQVSNSGPLNLGDLVKRISGPRSIVNGMNHQNSCPLPPVLPMTGLITSGPISSEPLNSNGAPCKVSGPVDSSRTVKLHKNSIAHNQAINNLSQDGNYPLRGSLPKAILWSV